MNKEFKKKQIVAICNNLLLQGAALIPELSIYLEKLRTEVIDDLDIKSSWSSIFLSQFHNWETMEEYIDPRNAIELIYWINNAQQ